MISLKQFGIAILVGIVFALPSLTSLESEPFMAIGGALAGLVIGIVLAGIVAVVYNLVSSSGDQPPEEQAA